MNLKYFWDIWYIKDFLMIIFLIKSKLTNPNPLSTTEISAEFFDSQPDYLILRGSAT